jgi:hypothetical protein
VSVSIYSLEHYGRRNFRRRDASRSISRMSNLSWHDSRFDIRTRFPDLSFILHFPTRCFCRIIIRCLFCKMAQRCSWYIITSVSDSFRDISINITDTRCVGCFPRGTSVSARLFFWKPQLASSQRPPPDNGFPTKKGEACYISTSNPPLGLGSWDDYCALMRLVLLWIHSGDFYR